MLSSEASSHPFGTWTRHSTGTVESCSSSIQARVVAIGLPRPSETVFGTEMPIWPLRLYVRKDESLSFPNQNSMSPALNQRMLRGPQTNRQQNPLDTTPDTRTSKWPADRAMAVLQFQRTNNDGASQSNNVAIPPLAPFRTHSRIQKHALSRGDQLFKQDSCEA
jgi:hypothetical protein